MQKTLNIKFKIAEMSVELLAYIFNLHILPSFPFSFP
jgi:hypothetical protein